MIFGKRSRWRPIDTAPYQTHVLVIERYGTMTVASLESGGRWIEAMRNEPITQELFYWRPLPDAPQVI